MAGHPVSQESHTYVVASAVQGLLTYPPILRHGFAYRSGSTTETASMQLNHSAKVIQILQISNKILKSQPDRCNHVEVYKRVLLMLPQLPYIANFLQTKRFVNCWQNWEDEIFVNRISQMSSARLHNTKMASNSEHN